MGRNSGNLLPAFLLVIICGLGCNDFSSGLWPGDVLDPLVGPPRGFAVGYKIKMEAFASPDAFHQDVSRIMDLIEPNVAPHSANLIVFPR